MSPDRIPHANRPSDLSGHGGQGGQQSATGTGFAGLGMGAMNSPGFWIGFSPVTIGAGAGFFPSPSGPSGSGLSSGFCARTIGLSGDTDKGDGSPRGIGLLRPIEGMPPAGTTG